MMTTLKSYTKKKAKAKFKSKTGVSFGLVSSLVMLPFQAVGLVFKLLWGILSFPFKIFSSGKPQENNKRGKK